MNLRRSIASILTLAFLAGQPVVPTARAACAIPKPRAAACPSCAKGPSTSAATIALDRSCCAAPSTFSDREPATVALDRVGQHRAAVAIVAPAATFQIAATLVPGPRIASAPPGASPPLLRTTILLI